MNWNVIWSQAITQPLVCGMKIKKNQTIGFPIPLYQSGNAIRVHMVNRHGKKPYRFGGMSVIYKEKIYPITVKGQKEFSIPVKAEIYSDVIRIPLEEASEISIRIHYYDKFMDTNAISEEAVQFAGNAAFDMAAKPRKPVSYEARYGVFKSIPAIDRVEIQSDAEPKVIIAFGDSITAMNRWVKPLAQRLYNMYKDRYTLLNSGISGNCLTYEPRGLLYQSFGRMGTSRCLDDVLSFKNVSAVILAFGINDISYMTPSKKSEVNLEKLIDETTKLTNDLHKRGLRVVCQTLGPRKGYPKFTDDMEAVRQDYNRWVRNCGIFDYVVDPESKLLEAGKTDVYQSNLHQGDFLHPNQAGGMVMADAYDLEGLTGESFS